MGRTVFGSVCKVMLTLVTIFTGGHAASDTLRIGGTGVALGGMIILAEAYEAGHPGTVIEVLPSLGSGGGIKAVVAQAIDLGLSARPLKESEISAGALEEEYASTPLAFVTSLDNDVVGITTKELAAIFSGTTTHWPSGKPIRLVMRPASESATKVLRSLSVDMERAIDDAMARPGLVSAITDQENAETLERLSGSFGLVAIGQFSAEKRRLRVLELDGVAPSVSASDNPEDPFLKTLRLISTKTASPLAVSFRDFVFSDEGKAILLAYDFRPAK